MRIVALFDDAPEMMAHRAEHKQAHVDYIRANQSEVLIGGGFREDEDGAFVGGMWVMEVSTKERAKQLVEADPYFHPQYRRYRLLLWGKVLENETVVL
ncbi:MAG: YciI family protein [Pseudomonadota bacterium]